MTDLAPPTIGIDLGGMHLRAALVDASGAPIVTRREPTDRAGGPSGVIAQMRRLIDAVRDARTTAIGIGVPGSVDFRTGAVIGIPALPGWEGVPLAATIEAATGLPCALENDAKAAAIGEWQAGAGRGCENMVYVTVSTGIGSAAIVDGRLLRGVGGLAGESGHARITDDPQACACGLTGCWQAVASGTALDARARAAASADPRSGLARHAGRRPATAVHVGLAARDGDPAACALLAEHAVLLGYGLANLQHLYSPARIVMGGGVSALLEPMRPDLERTLRKRLLPGFPPASIVAAALGDDAGVVGAAAQARAAATRAAA